MELYLQLVRIWRQTGRSTDNFMKLPWDAKCTPRACMYDKSDCGSWRWRCLLEMVVMKRHIPNMCSPVSFTHDYPPRRPAALFEILPLSSTVAMEIYPDNLRWISQLPEGQPFEVEWTSVPNIMLSREHLGVENQKGRIVCLEVN